MQKPPNAQEQQTENPTEGRIAKSRQSEPTSAVKEKPTGGTLDARPSVRETLKQIRSEQSKTAGRPLQNKSKNRPGNQHSPKKKSPKRKER